jgi:hypothetical protein
MSDDALIAWINGGATATVNADDAAAKLRTDFSLRFHQAVNPDGDLGTTEEEHQACVAERVYEVHTELNRLGELVYSSVWETLSASTRAALKRYISIAKVTVGR